MDDTPRPADAAAVCERFLCRRTRRITRFPNGAANYVFEVECDDGRTVVARLMVDASRRDVTGGMFWSGLLRPMGVPLPEVLHADAKAHPFAFMILERLPGTDLGDVYTTLSTTQKQTLAEQLASIQSRVTSLPPGHGYGFVHGYDGPFPHRTWRAELEAQLALTRQAMAAAKVYDVGEVGRVERCLDQFDDYLARVVPTPFLHDITTRNVLIHEGRLSGIVDVDDLCFGDPLFVVALTRMALLSMHWETDYISYWLEAAGLSAGPPEVLDLYTAIHCVNFMGELGQRFNRDVAAPVDAAHAGHLRGVLDDLLGRT